MPWDKQNQTLFLVLTCPHMIWLSSSEIRHRVLPQPLLAAGKTMDGEWIRAFKGHVPHISKSKPRCKQGTLLCCFVLGFSPFFLSPTNMVVDCFRPSQMWQPSFTIRTFTIASLNIFKPLWPVCSSDVCELANISTLRTAEHLATKHWPTISTMLIWLIWKMMKGRVLSFRVVALEVFELNVLWLSSAL